MAHLLKNLPAMQETQIQSTNGEDPLEKEMATHSSILAGRIPWTEEPGRLQSTGLQRVRHHCVTIISFHFTSIHDSWKNHSFDNTDLCRQSKSLWFLICCLGLSLLLFQGASHLISWLQSPSTFIRFSTGQSLSRV